MKDPKDTPQFTLSLANTEEAFSGPYGETVLISRSGFERKPGSFLMPVIPIDGLPFEVDLLSLEGKRQTQQLILNMLASMEPVQNQTTHDNIGFSKRKARDSIFKKTGNHERYTALGNIRELFQTAQYERTLPPDSRHASPYGQDVYLACCKFQGRLYSVRLQCDVIQPQNGIHAWYKDHHLYDISRDIASFSAERGETRVREIRISNVGLRRNSGLPWVKREEIKNLQRIPLSILRETAGWFSNIQYHGLENYVDDYGRFYPVSLSSHHTYGNGMSIVLFDECSLFSALRQLSHLMLSRLELEVEQEPQGKVQRTREMRQALRSMRLYLDGQDGRMSNRIRWEASDMMLYWALQRTKVESLVEVRDALDFESGIPRELYELFSQMFTEEENFVHAEDIFLRIFNNVRTELKNAPVFPVRPTTLGPNITTFQELEKPEDNDILLMTP